MILAVDTASYAASVALVDGGRSVEACFWATDGHAHRIFQEIEGLLARAGTPLEQVDCFAAAAGPGSFTGVRVALSAVKALAEVCGRPVAAVSSLRALAWFGSAPLRAPILDARRGEVYTALYDADLRLAAPEIAVRLEDWLDVVAARRAERIDAVPPNLALAVARIAERDFAAGLAVDPLLADANYVRPPDIRVPAA